MGLRTKQSYILPALAGAVIVLLVLIALLVAASALYLRGSGQPVQATTTTSASTSTTTDSTSTTTSLTTPSTTTTTSQTTTTILETTISTSTTLLKTTTTIPSQYAGKGYHKITLDITIPSPHCEQALITDLSQQSGIVTMNVRRRQANNMVIYNPKLISKEKILEITASVGDSVLLNDVEI